MTVADAASPCVTCKIATDTALAFAGPPEFCMAALMTLGVPDTEARAMFAERFGDEVSEYPEHLEVIYRVCAACVAASPAGFPTPFLTTPGAQIPAISPRAA